MYSASFPISERLSSAAYQVDKVLVADLSISVAVSERQQDFQFVGVEFRPVGGQQVPEPLCADEARIIWVVLQVNIQRRCTGD